MRLGMILLFFFLYLGIIFLSVMGFKKKIGECGEQTREAFAEKTQHSYQAVNGIKEITVSQKRQFLKHITSVMSLEK